ncbi:Aste57867_4436 [Aphanomyces stellatus]|uniref:Aste57867_4436 protein n=1 Tax=Aphanomyces stellatus TaxID=120398 RepID=A0A485KD32_9STRA|nr:hypothetical protein As57867_004424 [Aphanomyces stellatus]VFT81547.1 Aste57867_4436 [Aphanomyces stellatus]
MVTIASAASICANFNDGDVISLQADLGGYVERCNGCIIGETTPDSATLQSTIAGPWGYWTVRLVGNGKIALQADTGKFLSRCNGCIAGATVPDAAFVHVPSFVGNPWSQWTCVDTAPGKIALQGDTTKFLGRCLGCARTADGTNNALFIKDTTWQAGPWNQFAVAFKSVAKPPVCSFRDGEVISLQADNGGFVARCNNCIPGASYPDSAVLQSSVSGPWGYWTVRVQSNGQIGLQADSGRFLARCNGCVAGATNPNEAFVHVPLLAGNPWALWQCVDAGNGKIALKGDIGNFLGRCLGCVRTADGTNQAVFVKDSTFQNAPWTQFTVTRKPLAVLAMAADAGLDEPMSSHVFLVLSSMLAGVCLALVAVFAYSKRREVGSTKSERSKFVAI